MVPYLRPNIRCPTFDVRPQVESSHATKKHTSLPQNFPQCAQVTPIYRAGLARHGQSIKDGQGNAMEGNSYPTPCEILHLTIHQDTHILY